MLTPLGALTEDPVILPELPTYIFTQSLPGYLSVALTLLLPILAALVMRQTWSSGVKGVVLLAVSAVKVFLEAWLVVANQPGQTFNFTEVGITVGINFAVAVVMYFGIWRGTGIQRAALFGGIVKNKVPERVERSPSTRR